MRKGRIVDDVMEGEWDGISFSALLCAALEVSKELLFEEACEVSVVGGSCCRERGRGGGV
jgi:hypothetical protein